MREEYDKIQKAMKDNMKRSTPFERIRRFFSRGKYKGKYFEKYHFDSLTPHLTCVSFFTYKRFPVACSPAISFVWLSIAINCTTHLFVLYGIRTVLDRWYQI